MRSMRRRDFLRTACVTSTAAATGLWVSPALAARTPSPGEVVKVTNPAMMGAQFPVEAVARDMVFAAVQRLTGEDDPGRAFRRFVGPTDKVGIKVNCLAGRFSSTSREVAYAVVEGVRRAGVPDANIVVLDQYAWALRQARYFAPRPDAVRTIFHDEVADGFTPESRVVGCRFRWAKSFLACDRVINVPVIKDHNLTGVTCAFKNVGCGVIDAPPHLHRLIHEALPRLYATDEVRSRVCLIVCDASVIQYSNGPKVALDFRKPLHTVYATTDPVAMDAVAADLVEAARTEARLPALARQNRAPRFLQVATALGLGLPTPALL